MGLAKASKYKFPWPLAITLHIKTKYQYMNHEIYLSFPLLQNKPFLNLNQILVHSMKREHTKRNLNMQKVLWYCNHSPNKKIKAYNKLGVLHLKLSCKIMVCGKMKILHLPLIMDDYGFKHQSKVTMKTCARWHHVMEVT
jgi:hypothetical protein